MVNHPHDEFYLAYGKALASWALIEDNLCNVFCIACKMAPFGGLGRAIFFSGRSFATRADLLSAVIPLSPFESDHQEFLKAILKKARQFSAGRNAIAHGIPVNLHSHDESYTGPKVKEGRTSWESGGIGIDALLMAQINFNSLAEIIEQAVFPSAQREEYLLRVQALPNEAFVRG